MNRLLLALPVLIALGLGGFFFVGLGKDPKIVPSALIDKPVPEFDTPALRADGKGLTTSDLKGEVTLLNVFASWCIPCRAEHPVWMDLAETKEVAILGLNYKDKPNNALKWLKDLGDPYDRIGSDLSGRVGIDWGVYGVPETFVIDKAGHIRYKHVGPLTADIMNDDIMPLVRSLQQ